MEAFFQANQSDIYTYLFCGTFILVALWEQFSPLRGLSVSMKTRWFSNFSLMFINTLLLWAIFPSFGIGAALIAAEKGWGLLRIIELPYWLMFAIAFMLMDLGHYLIHYLFHQVPVLWRMHRLHHTDQDFDFTTGVRFHPTEAVLEYGANVAVVALLGPPVMAVVVFAFGYLLTTFWVHGNIKMPAGWDRRIRWVFITPEMHRTHHSQIQSETDSNYGGMFSFWDRLFGNYIDEPELGHEGMDIGISEFTDERHIHLGPMLSNPFMTPTDTEEMEISAGLRK